MGWDKKKGNYKEIKRKKTLNLLNSCILYTTITTKCILWIWGCGKKKKKIQKKRGKKDNKKMGWDKG